MRLAQTRKLLPKALTELSKERVPDAAGIFLWQDWFVVEKLKNSYNHG